MRRVLLADVAGVFGLKFNATKIEPTPIDAAYERESHFKQLQQCGKLVYMESSFICRFCVFPCLLNNTYLFNMDGMLVK